MAFDNNTNRGRVTRILETLILIDKSADSNEAGEVEVRAMLDPLYQKLGIVSEEKPGAEPEPKGRIGSSAPPWASVMDMANEADLKDLSSALIIYHHRLTEEVFQAPAP